MKRSVGLLSYLDNGQGKLLPTGVVHAEDPVGEEGLPHVGHPEHVEGEGHVEQDHGVGQVLAETGHAHRALAEMVELACASEE